MAKKATDKKSAGKGSGGKRQASGDAAAKGPTVNPRFVELSGKLESAKAQPYRMASVYIVDSKIEHPKFGVGFVVASFPDKIEVAFEDANRNLVQGRK